MRLVFENQTFSYELLRTISYTPYGGADIGECLKTAYQIKEGDFESWYKEWNKTARQVHDLADSALAIGQRVSAREAYLRASNYYRTAEFFLHGNPEDPRILRTWGNSRDTFRKASQLMDTPVEEVRIPYEDTTISGYFYRVDNSSKPRPTLIINGGYDSTVEELHFFGSAAGAIQREYNCLTFDGPGQGSALREQHLPFRPDWEHVVTPVVDYLINRPEVDAKRIALMGNSLGGYLAPRAAAFEHRLAACIANDGVYAARQDAGTLMGENELEDMQHMSGENMREVVDQLKQKDSFKRWIIENGLFSFQVNSLSELLEKMESFTLEGIAEKIACPTLVLEAEGDDFLPDQPKQLYEALTSPKTYRKFAKEEGAEEHCQMGGQLLFNYEIFKWLDQTLQHDSK